MSNPSGSEEPSSGTPPKEKRSETLSTATIRDMRLRVPAAGRVTQVSHKSLAYRTPSAPLLYSSPSSPPPPLTASEALALWGAVAAYGEDAGYSATAIGPPGSKHSTVVRRSPDSRPRDDKAVHGRVNARPLARA